MLPTYDFVGITVGLCIAIACLNGFMYSVAFLMRTMPRLRVARDLFLAWPSCSQAPPRQTIAIHLQHAVLFLHIYTGLRDIEYEFSKMQKLRPTPHGSNPTRTPRVLLPPPPRSLHTLPGGPLWPRCQIIVLQHINHSFHRSFLGIIPWMIHSYIRSS